MDSPNATARKEITCVISLLDQASWMHGPPCKDQIYLYASSEGGGGSQPACHQLTADVDRHAAGRTLPPSCPAWRVWDY